MTSAPRASASSTSCAVVPRLGSAATKYGMSARSPRARMRAKASSMRDTGFPRRLGASGAPGRTDGVDVLVTTPGQGDHQAGFARQLGREAHGVGHGVRGLERGDDALEP